MPAIVRLPDEVIRHIAAGEVVQSCMNVIKELLENAIDAGSKNITITLKKAGYKTIVIQVRH